MLLLTKTVHVLALGLWFGSAVFFSFPVALSLFGTLEGVARRPGPDRPVWLPLPGHYERDIAGQAPAGTLDGKRLLFADAEELRKYQGTRAAGEVISPMFDWYFLVQGACGLLALATALAWWNAPDGRRLHRARAAVLLLAVLTVLAGWPLEQKVSRMRVERARATDRVLDAWPNVTAAEYDAALRLRADFGRWHFYSLMLNFGTIALVTAAMALAARLPSERETASRRETPAGTAGAFA